MNLVERFGLLRIWARTGSICDSKQIQGQISQGNGQEDIFNRKILLALEIRASNLVPE